MAPLHLSPFGYDPEWVVEGVLAKSGAPGTDKAGVEAWIHRVKDEMKVKSVICMLSDFELAEYYRGAWPLDLYRDAGLRVRHIPVEDPIAMDRGIYELERALPAVAEAFANLPKPVVIHCLAGEHRTGAAVRACLAHRGFGREAA